MQNTRFVFVGLHYLKLQIIDTATEPDVANDVPPLASIAGQLLFLTSSPGNTTITEHSLWRFSRALLRAINERQFEDIELLIDEDIDWTSRHVPLSRRAARQGGGDRGDQADRRELQRPPPRSRTGHAGRGFGGIDA